MFDFVRETWLRIAPYTIAVYVPACYAFAHFVAWAVFRIQGLKEANAGLMGEVDRLRRPQ